MNNSREFEYRTQVSRYLAIPEISLKQNSHLNELVHSNQNRGVRISWSHNKILIEEGHSNIDMIILMLEDVEWHLREDVVMRYP